MITQILWQLPLIVAVNDVFAGSLHYMAHRSRRRGVAGSSRLDVEVDGEDVDEEVERRQWQLERSVRREQCSGISFLLRLRADQSRIKNGKLLGVDTNHDGFFHGSSYETGESRRA